MGNTNPENDTGIPTVQKLIAIFWPSFLVAGIETIVFFTFFDPLYVFTDYDVSRLGAYSIGFFLFWFFAIIPCVLTMYFARPCRPCAVYQDDVKKSKD